jgi:hypothetical protein
VNKPAESPVELVLLEQLRVAKLRIEELERENERLRRKTSDERWK